MVSKKINFQIYTDDHAQLVLLTGNVTQLEKTERLSRNQNDPTGPEPKATTQ